MNKTENSKINIIDRIKSNKKLQYGLIVIIAIVIIVVLVLGILPSSTKTQSTAENSVEAYVISLERRLTETLNNVKGVGKVSVVITVEGGMETVLANKTTETKNGSSTEIEETPIIINGKTVVLKELYPKISGVLIVAEGADNIMVLNKIQQATVSLLNIDASQVEILTMK